MQLVVCGMWRPVRLEKSEQNLGQTRKHGPPTSKSFPSACCATWNVRQLGQHTQALGEQQTEGYSPAEVLVEGFQERSSFTLMEELRMCITIDNHEAVKSGDLDKAQASLLVAKHKFTADFPEVVSGHCKEKKKACCHLHRHYECGRQWRSHRWWRTRTVSSLSCAEQST